MDLSFWELAVIALLAFLVFGPEETLRQANRLGKMLRKLQSQAENFKIMAQEKMRELDEEGKKIVDVEAIKIEDPMIPKKASVAKPRKDAGGKPEHPHPELHDESGGQGKHDDEGKKS